MKKREYDKLRLEELESQFNRREELVKEKTPEEFVALSLELEELRWERIESEQVRSRELANEAEKLMDEKGKAFDAFAKMGEVNNARDRIYEGVSLISKEAALTADFARENSVPYKKELNIRVDTTESERVSAAFLDRMNASIERSRLDEVQRNTEQNTKIIKEGVQGAKEGLPTVSEKEKTSIVNSIFDSIRDVAKKRSQTNEDNPKPKKTPQNKF
ncbi:hypothetical protein [Vibrio crassostreae]|uniref:hypothetical protein n=1 Tax=Vibrio crassostreae TaxID=246167 RepID=UPI001B30C061|nr:hypothetical protein [Vibrio crassostreae]